MLEYSPIIILFSISFFLSGCIPVQRKNLSIPLTNSESILCQGQSNPMISESENKSLVFYIDVARPHKDKEVNLTSVKVSKRIGTNQYGPIILLGKSFKENDVFSFQGKTWQVLEIGFDGIAVNGEEWCRRGFIRIRQLP
jgi:hypothetical protein